MGIANMSPRTGRILKEDGSYVNEADALMGGRTTAIAGKTTVAIAGTPVALASNLCGGGVTFIAALTNTGEIYVYPAAGAKTDVIPLRAGDSIFWPVASLAALKVDASISGESVHWMGAI